MTLLTRPGDGPAFPYAGQPVHILAGQDGLPPGFAAMELTIPGHFAGPIPHAHDEFDEAIYVLSGQLLVAGDDAPRGRRRAQCLWLLVVTGTVSAIHQRRMPRCWAFGRRRSPLLPSCAISVPSSRPAHRLTRSACERFTPGTPAACCPDGSRRDAVLADASSQVVIPLRSPSANAMRKGSCSQPGPKSPTRC